MKQVQKGFTLIELMIVVAIIGILAAVAIPAYQDYVTKAKLSKISSTIDPLKMALSMYAQENGSFPSGAIDSSTFAAGDIWSSIGLSDAPTVPTELQTIGYSTATGLPRLVMTFKTAGVGSGIDGLAVTQEATTGGTGVVWSCVSGDTPITSAVAKKYYGCTY